MKNSGQCPKCKSTEILKLQESAPNKYKNSILVRSGFSPSKNIVLIIRYVCESCGFTEEWIDNPDDIARLRESHVSKEHRVDKSS